MNCVQEAVGFLDQFCGVSAIEVAELACGASELACPAALSACLTL